MESILIWILAIPFTGIFLWIINKEAEFFYEKLRKNILSLIVRIFKSEPKIDTNVISFELNDFFKGEVKFLKIFENELPEIEVIGMYNDGGVSELEKELETKAIAYEGKTNESHLLLKEYNIDTLPPRFEVELTKFETIRLLRKKNIKPRILSAGGVLIDPEQKILIVHKRSLNSDTYPGYYHILGGAMLGKESKLATTFDHRLSDTVHRELLEETESKIEAINLDVRYRSFAEELETGFIQYEYLGITCRIISDLRDFNGNWEGDIQPISFDKLEDALISKKWVSTGKAHILAWLALGAPNSEYFSFKQANNIYKNVLENMKCQ